MVHNLVKEIRESRLISKNELAKTAGVSPITVDRIERGLVCRISTKRKLLFALGYGLEDRRKVFPRD
ncbi:MAG: helix-turn-helix transcriptional regulator [Deltaproteobacteria bacterium]|nr:helix-turn-helix transcriptional regulator [Deltaproteobacteria bacterium]